MTKYHINDKGDANVCNAQIQCRFGDVEKDHYSTKEDARAAYEEKMSMANQTFTTYKKAGNFDPKKSIVNHALYSSLEWNDEDPKPEWWDEYTEDSLKEERDENGRLLTGHSSLPELLNKIEIDGKEAAVVWQPESQSESDYHVADSAGKQISVLEIMDIESGDTIAEIKISRGTEEAFTRSFGKDAYTNIRYLNEFSGSSVKIPEKSDDKNQEFLNRKQVWADAHKKFAEDVKNKEGRYISPRNVTVEDAPDDLKTLNKDLRGIKAPYVEPISDSKKYFKTPFIDYSYVQDEHKGKGIGTAAYIYAARKLGKNNDVLRGSGVQSDEAQGLWNRFKETLPKENVSTTKLKANGKVKEYHVLDFRNESK